MIRVLALAAVVCVTACAAPDLPEPTEQPRPVAVEQPVVKEAANTKAAARRYVETRPDLSSGELIRMLDLSQAMQRAVRRARARPTARNVRGAKDAIAALRGFMSSEGTKPQ
jgi:chromatin segregation and condensation protein Rec8/ScpA/Scc1 (kleisin family)